jgi:hypothetical protein
MREKMLLSCVTLCAAVSWVGCSASGPAFHEIQVPAGKSVIYAYRPKSIFGAAIQPSVNCGGPGPGLAPGGYHPFVVEPGTVTCTAKTEARSEVQVDATSDGPSYVRERIGIGFFVGHPHLEVVDTATGAREIQACKQQ